MSRPAHFLDPYKFQIEEMVKLGCSDEHIHKVLHDMQKTEFTRDDLIRYMDNTGIRKRRAAKRWTRSQAYKKHTVEDCLRKWGVNTKRSVASGQENTEKV